MAEPPVLDEPVPDEPVLDEPVPDERVPSPAERLAAETLLADYADAIDAGDFGRVADLLAGAEVQTADGTVVAAGRDAVLALYEGTTRRHEDGTPRTAHLVTNLVVRRDGPDHLEVRSRFVVLQATGSVPLQPVVTGRYEDRLGRHGGGWRFERRRMCPDLWGDVSDHLTFTPDVPSRPPGGRRG